MARPRTALLLATILFGTVACPASPRAAPLTELTGALRGAPSTPAHIDPRTGVTAIDRRAAFAHFGDPVGSFDLQSAGGDLRSDPGTLTLTVAGGTLTASAGTPARKNGVRRVDPASGRPLRGDAAADATCPTGAEAGCLQPCGTISADGATLTPDPQCTPPPTAGNHDVFDALCEAVLDPTYYPPVCDLTIWESLNNPLNPTTFDRDTIKPLGQLTVSGFFANALAGNAGSSSIVAFMAGAAPPFVRSNEDPCDGSRTDGCAAKGAAATPDFGPFGAPNFPATPNAYAGTRELNQVLTDEQEALLGCGAFYGRDCEVDGIDLFNSEAGVLAQSTLSGDQVSLEGTQPGTVGYANPPVAIRDVAGMPVVLPGARGPADPGYDPLVDGCTSASDGGDACAASHELATPAAFGDASGQRFANEMAVVSSDLQVLTAAFSEAPDTGGSPAPNAPVLPPEFDFQDPYTTAAGQCSWAQPQLCGGVANGRSYGTLLLDDDPSGSPRARWLWESGAVYHVTDATGTLAGFANGVVHVLGPEVSRIPGFAVGVPMLLVPADATVLDPASGLVAPGLDGESGTADDPRLGIAYGVAPEPASAWAQAAALAALALRAATASGRRSRRGR